MKIGTIRRIDDLGRIVLPKSIRQNLRIKSGDNLEIFIEKNDIILRKYSELNKISDIEKNIAKVLKETLKSEVIITNKDKVIIAEGPSMQKYINQEISDILIKNLDNRKLITKENIMIINNKIEKGEFIINPIIINGDVIGLIILKTNKIDEQIINSVIILTTFLIKNIE